MNLNSLINNVKESVKQPCWQLELDRIYIYHGNGDLFSRTFAFEVLEDNPTEYLILVETQFKTPLEKTYELIDAINDGTIEDKGPKDQVLADFDLKSFLEEIDEDIEKFEEMSEELEEIEKEKDENE